MESLKIELELDRAKAEAEAKRFHEGEKKRVAEGKAAVEKAERDKTQTAVTEGHKRDQAEDRAAEKAKARARDDVRAYAEANKEKLAELAKTHQAQTSLAQRGVEGMRGLTAAVAASAAGMTGLMAAATSASGAIEEAFRQAREQARLASGETIGLQKQLLQMANLRGGGTQEALRAVAAEMSQTGLSFEGAAALRTEAQLGGRGFASEKEFAEFVQRSGRLGTISGQSGQSMGRAARLIGDMGGGSLTANEAETRLLLANELAQRGGLDVASFLEQSRQTRDIVSSGALTEGQAGGLLALYAARGGGAEEVKALVEATSGDKRGVIGAAMGWSDRLAGVQDPMAFLKDQGLGDGQAKAIAEFAAARGRWDKDILPVINAAPQPGTIDQRFAEMARTDPAVRQARVDAAAQLATITRGQGGLREQLRRQEYEKLRASGQTNLPFEEFDKGLSLTDFANPWQWSKIYYGEHRDRLDELSVEALVEQARAEGIDVSPGSRAGTLAREIMDLDPSGGWTGGRRSEPEINRRFDELGSMIAGQGGDPLAALNRFAEGADKILRAAEINAANARQQPMPALQGAPRQPPAAPR